MTRMFSCELLERLIPVRHLIYQKTLRANLFERFSWVRQGCRHCKRYGWTEDKRENGGASKDKSGAFAQKPEHNTWRQSQAGAMLDFAKVTSMIKTRSPVIYNHHVYPFKAFRKLAKGQGGSSGKSSASPRMGSSNSDNRLTLCAFAPGALLSLSIPAKAANWNLGGFQPART
jgi:hypothetical protein